MNKNLAKVAKKLRREGKSYSEINRLIHVPKSTLSCWLSQNKWSRQITKKLCAQRVEEDRNRLIKINKGRRLITLIKYDQYRKEATKVFPTLCRSPLFLIGLSLYWGEGQKTDKGIVGVINSDVGLVKTVADFYRKVLKMPEEKLRVALFLYKDNDLNSALKFWSKSLNIPLSQFIKTQILPSRAKITKKKVKYGICNVYFANTELNIKIRQWINLLAQKSGIIH